MRVFVTGATGFIGRALIPRLQRDGHAVVAWVRTPARARGLLGAEVELVHVLVVGEHAGQRLVFAEHEPVGVLGVAVLGHRHRLRAVDDEVRPALLGLGHVLDQPAEGQLADREPLTGLLVGDALHGVAEEAAVGGEGLEEVVAFGHEKNSRRPSGHFLTALTATLENMANTSSRTLRLLSLLQTHRYWPGAELADRLEVSRAHAAPRRRPAPRARLPGRRAPRRGGRLPARRRGGAAAARGRRRGGRRAGRRPAGGGAGRGARGSRRQRCGR